MILPDFGLYQAADLGPEPDSNVPQKPLPPPQEERGWARIARKLAFATGYDYLMANDKKFQNQLTEYTESPGPHLPVDGDLKLIAKIYADRFVRTYTYPFVMTSRLLALDVIYKKIFKNKPIIK